MIDEAKAKATVTGVTLIGPRVSRAVSASSRPRIRYIME